jgi:hypothetical protein
MERNAQIPAQFSVSANTQRDAAAGYLLTGSSASELTSEPGQLQTTMNVRELDAESC